MEYDIIMPRLSENMEKGRLVAWYKKVGDKVKKDEPLFQVETEKFVVDVVAEKNGILERILHAGDTELPITTVVGKLLIT